MLYVFGWGNLRCPTLGFSRCETEYAVGFVEVLFGISEGQYGFWCRCEACESDSKLRITSSISWDLEIPPSITVSHSSLSVQLWYECVGAGGG